MSIIIIIIRHPLAPPTTINWHGLHNSEGYALARCGRIRMEWKSILSTIESSDWVTSQGNRIQFHTLVLTWSGVEQQFLHCCAAIIFPRSRRVWADDEEMRRTHSSPTHNFIIAADDFDRICHRVLRWGRGLGALVNIEEYSRVRVCLSDCADKGFVRIKAQWKRRLLLIFPFRRLLRSPLIRTD